MYHIVPSCDIVVAPWRWQSATEICRRQYCIIIYVLYGQIGFEIWIVQLYVYFKKASSLKLTWYSWNRKRRKESKFHMFWV